MRSIDLNCDMGESFGAWRMGNDAALMDYVSSVNIACGFHAGDASTIRRTIETAIEKNVAIGAHPSYPDLQGFGRRAMAMSPDEVFDIVLYQVSALKGICEALGGKLQHVKPHGALYNQAANDANLANAIARAVKQLDPQLVLYGLSGSSLITEAEKLGLRTASEAFSDRTYKSDGNLTPRSEPNAVITDAAKSVDQVIQLVTNGSVNTSDGGTIPLKADTICIHGDGINALEIARAINRSLKEAGIRIKPV